MDPHLFDMLWEAYREVGAHAADPDHLRLSLAGHQRDAARALERRRANSASTPTATRWTSIFPACRSEKIREIGLRLQRGGVGFYPTSGSPFVHMDTGSIRHWPRMTHAQLVKRVPGRPHRACPSDGRPLPGYALALADVERRGNAPNAVSLAAARDAGAIAEATGAGRRSAATRAPKRPSFFAQLVRVRARTRSADHSAGRAAPAKPVRVQVASAGQDAPLEPNAPAVQKAVGRCECTAQHRTCESDGACRAGCAVGTRARW